MPLPGEPAGGTQVQLRHELRGVVGQLRAQQLAQQGVCAVAAGEVAAGFHQDVPPHQGEQRHGGSGIVGELLGQLDADHVEHAGAEQEVAQLLRLGVQDLAGEVLRQVRVLRPGQPPLGAGVALGRRQVCPGERRELQSRGPALGVRHERVQGLIAEVDVRPQQQLARLVLGEGQVGGADLRHGAGHPVTLHRQQRVHPAEQDADAGSRRPAAAGAPAVSRHLARR